MIRWILQRWGPKLPRPWAALLLNGLYINGEVTDWEGTLAMHIDSPTTLSPSMPAGDGDLGETFLGGCRNAVFVGYGGSLVDPVMLLQKEAPHQRRRA